MISANTATRLALLGSVGLNLFLLGTMVPGWFHRPPHDQAAMERALPPPGMIGPMAALRRVAEELSPEDAAVLRNAINPDHSDFKQMAQALRQAVDSLREILKTEPFDEAAFRNALADMASVREKFEVAQQEALVSAIAKLSPDGRRRLAEWKGPVDLRPGEGGRPGPAPMPGGPGAIPFDHGRGPMARPGPLHGPGPMPGPGPQPDDGEATPPVPPAPDSKPDQ